jgi:hypothetical protein
MVPLRRPENLEDRERAAPGPPQYTALSARRCEKVLSDCHLTDKCLSSLSIVRVQG